jgi:hypothetical protein
MGHPMSDIVWHFKEGAAAHLADMVYEFARAIHERGMDDYHPLAGPTGHVAGDWIDCPESVCRRTADRLHALLDIQAYIVWKPGGAAQPYNRGFGQSDEVDE